MSTPDTTRHGCTASSRRPVKVTVYHNNEARFLPYEDGQLLTTVTSHWLDTPDPEPVAVAEWAFHTFNADLDLLETDRHTPHGKATFLAGSVYRLLDHRSLSVGDVVEVHTEAESHWMACDPTGWRSISEPRYTSGDLLSAAVVYQHLAAARNQRRDDDPKPAVLTGDSATTAGRSRRAFTVTAHVTIDADADLNDPFVRAAYFRALVTQLTTERRQLDTAFGAGNAQIGAVTAVS